MQGRCIPVRIAMSQASRPLNETINVHFSERAHVVFSLCVQVIYTFLNFG